MPHALASRLPLLAALPRQTRHRPWRRRPLETPFGDEPVQAGSSLRARIARGAMALDATDVLGAATVLLAGAVAYLLVEAVLPAEFPTQADQAEFRAEFPTQAERGACDRVAETLPIPRVAVLASAPHRDVEVWRPAVSPR